MGEKWDGELSNTNGKDQILQRLTCHTVVWLFIVRYIYVTDVFDFLNAAHEYSSIKFCKSWKLSSELFKINYKKWLF
jgi:hypothetical protein